MFVIKVEQISDYTDHVLIISSVSHSIQHFIFQKPHTHTRRILYPNIAKHNFQSVFSVMLWRQENSLPETSIIGPFYGDMPEVRITPVRGHWSPD